MFFFPSDLINAGVPQGSQWKRWELNDTGGVNPFEGGSNALKKTNVANNGECAPRRFELMNPQYAWLTNNFRPALGYLKRIGL